jgi:UDP-glucose 4-epimerase
MTLDDAVDLVLYAFEHGEQGDLFVQKAPATTIDVLAESLMKYMKKKVPIRNIGIRHGEKAYEVLVTKEEMLNAIELEKYYRVPTDTRDLNYNLYLSEGNEKIEEMKEYSSHNTKRLDVDGVIDLLNKIDIRGE